MPEWPPAKGGMRIDLNEEFMRVAAHVHPGEWTTYGDISAAVRGDKRAARAVGRAAATEDEFPNPHRVLRSPGRISPGVGACSGGRGVEDVRERLFAEGVVFDETGRADPAKHVHWDELRRRWNRRVRGVGSAGPQGLRVAGDVAARTEQLEHPRQEHQ